MNTRGRLDRIEDNARTRAAAVLDAVFRAAPDDCRIVARMAREGHNPTSDDLEALDRVKGLLRAEMERAGFDPDAPPVPGLIDGWTAPGAFGRITP